MKVILMAHTQLSEEFYDRFDIYGDLLNYVGNSLDRMDVSHGQAIALSAIRTCYSANKPSEIVKTEGGKYFGDKGKEAARLINHIVRSGHTSTLEHISFTFAVEGVSRALLAQLTRHRVGFSFSVQSQRYVRMGSGDKIGGFDYVVPDSVKKIEKPVDFLDSPGTTKALFDFYMDMAQKAYDALREAGVPPEDARAVLPNAAATNLVLTVNLRALLDFYAKRKPGNGAQAEIAELAERLKEEAVKVEPWLKPFFEGEEK